MDQFSPRTVTSLYKYATPKKDEKANPFDQNILRFKLWFWSIGLFAIKMYKVKGKKII